MTLHGKVFAGCLVAVVLAVALTAFCFTTKTAAGKCIGLFDDPASGTEYRVDKGNAILGIVLWETLVVPAVVVLYDARCPVAQ